MTKPIVRLTPEEIEAFYNKWDRIASRYPIYNMGKMPKPKKCDQTPRKRGKSRIGKRRRKK